ncbi:hypothetical protein OG594_30400 [Streptomyces sp. NBC_01214]|uniref:hypothetical protein n=1 Tax=Streptomyces sp. NBC_01214 TaxID=2903777 RepID=UPI0022533CFA|nr:hypothetical protein [Streptomyces sp. NBC_01214]MCX4805880.1 hypothetical protein [Streptomyces sp. NBC_01214]
MGVEQLEGPGTGQRPLLDFPLSRRGDVLPQECAWLREKAPVARVGLRDLLRARAGELLDALVAEGGPADLRAGFADPFSAALHCQVLGVPFEDRRRLMSGLDVAFMTAREPFADSALNWYKDVGYFADRLHDQLALAPEERTGLLGRFAGLKEADPESAHLTDEMFATVAVSLFGAGAVSTSAFLTLAVLALLQRPELIGYLRRHPERMAGAVEELLRWNLSVGDGLPCIALEVLVERLPGLRLAVPSENLVWRTGFIKRLPERLPVAW